MNRYWDCSIYFFPNGQDTFHSFILWHLMIIDVHSMLLLNVTHSTDLVLQFPHLMLSIALTPFSSWSFPSLEIICKFIKTYGRDFFRSRCYGDHHCYFMEFTFITWFVCCSISHLISKFPFLNHATLSVYRKLSRKITNNKKVLPNKYWCLKKIQIMWREIW